MSGFINGNKYRTRYQRMEGKGMSTEQREEKSSSRNSFLYAMYIYYIHEIKPSNKLLSVIIMPTMFFYIFQRFSKKRLMSEGG